MTLKLKPLQIASIRMKDMRNLFLTLFVEFVPNDPIHQIEVYKGLGHALGEHLNFFRDNKASFPNELIIAIEALDKQVLVFLQNLVTIINLMNRTLEPPEGNIEQNSIFYNENISLLIDDIQLELAKILPIEDSQGFDSEYEAQEAQSKSPEKRYQPIWLVALCALILALITQHLLYNIDFLGVLCLAFFYAVMFWKIESRFE